MAAGMANALDRNPVTRGSTPGHDRVRDRSSLLRANTPAASPVPSCVQHTPRSLRTLKIPCPSLDKRRPSSWWRTLNIPRPSLDRRRPSSWLRTLKIPCPSLDGRRPSSWWRRNTQVSGSRLQHGSYRRSWIKIKTDEQVGNCDRANTVCHLSTKLPSFKQRALIVQVTLLLDIAGESFDVGLESDTRSLTACTFSDIWEPLAIRVLRRILHCSFMKLPRAE